MKNPEEILRGKTHSLMDDQEEEYICVLKEDAIKAMLAYHAQFQPSEEVRELSDEEVNNEYHKWVDDKLVELDKKIKYDDLYQCFRYALSLRTHSRPNGMRENIIQFLKKWDDEQIEIYNGVGVIGSVKDTEKWVEGAKFMRDKLLELVRSALASEGKETETPIK